MGDYSKWYFKNVLAILLVPNILNPILFSLAVIDSVVFERR